MLFFTNHQTDYIGELKARKDYNAEDCVETVVTRNDGLKAEQKYSSEDCGATMIMGKDGLKANGNKAQKIVEQPWLRAKTG